MLQKASRKVLLALHADSSLPLTNYHCPSTVSAHTPVLIRGFNSTISTLTG